MLCDMWLPEGLDNSSKLDETSDISQISSLRPQTIRRQNDKGQASFWEGEFCSLPIAYWHCPFVWLAVSKSCQGLSIGCHSLPIAHWSHHSCPLTHYPITTLYLPCHLHSAWISSGAPPWMFHLCLCLHLNCASFALHDEVGEVSGTVAFWPTLHGLQSVTYFEYLFSSSRAWKQRDIFSNLFKPGEGQSSQNRWWPNLFSRAKFYFK